MLLPGDEQIWHEIHRCILTGQLLPALTVLTTHVSGGLSAKDTPTSTMMDSSPAVSTPLFVVFTTLFIVFLLLAVLTARQRRLHHHGDLFTARCANLAHNTWKSRNTSELRAVQRNLLDAVRGPQSRRTKICQDCLYKLMHKPEFRKFFKVCSFVEKKIRIQD